MPVNNAGETITEAIGDNNPTGGIPSSPGAVFMVVSEGVEDRQNEDIEESDNQQQ